MRRPLPSLLTLQAFAWTRPDFLAPARGIGYKAALFAAVPPFWQNWQFWLAVSLGLALLLLVGYQWRVRAVREQNIRLATAINEQKRVEAELRESDARFRAMFDNTAVGVALMTLDRHIVQINPTVTRITGYSAEEMAGMDPSGMVFEEDRTLDRDLFIELVTGVRDQYLIEKRYLRKDGSLFWGRINFALVRGDDDKPLYIVGMIEEITEEKRAAERLAAQEAEYRRLLEKRIAERTEELNLVNERLRETAARNAVIAERTRLARDLHDAVTQTLFSTTLIADVLPDIWEMDPTEGKRRLEELRQLTRGALAEMRTLLVELRPNAQVEVPLPALLRQLTEAMIGRGRLDIQLERPRGLPTASRRAGRALPHRPGGFEQHRQARQSPAGFRYPAAGRPCAADHRRRRRRFRPRHGHSRSSGAENHARARRGARREVQPLQRAWRGHANFHRLERPSSEPRSVLWRRRPLERFGLCGVHTWRPYERRKNPHYARR